MEDGKVKINSKTIIDAFNARGITPRWEEVDEAITCAKTNPSLSLDKVVSQYIWSGKSREYLPKQVTQEDISDGIYAYNIEPAKFNNNVDWFEAFVDLLPTTFPEPVSRKYCLDLAAKAKYGTVAELLREADKIYNYLTA